MKWLYIILFSLFIISGCKEEMPTDKPDDHSNGNNSFPKDTLYVGGHFSSAGDILVNNIARWDGKNWSPLGKGIIGSIECMAFYKGELYVGGFIDSAGGIPVENIARWDGIEWAAVGSGINGRVTSLVVYKNELYAGGWYFIAGGMQADNIARWDGTNWSQVGEGFSDEVYALAIYKDKLYAGGWFTKNQLGYCNADKIARWDGAIWDTVGGGMTNDGHSSSWVHNLIVFNDELYASGNFQKCDGLSVSYIARWNDTTWSPVGEGIESSLTYTAAVFQNELVVGGEFDSLRAPYVTYWNGTDWKPGKFTVDGLPYYFYTHGNNFYAGGEFKSANGIIVNGIFRWDGAEIYSLGKGVQGYVSSMLVY